MTEDNGYVKLKASFTDIMETFNLDGKSQSDIIKNGGLFKHDILAEAVVKLIDICQNVCGMYESKYNGNSLDISNIVEKVKNLMTDMVPSLVTNALESNF